MSPAVWFAALGALIAVVGLAGVVACIDRVRRIVAVNILGTGVFLVLTANAWRSDPGNPDPVPHALVLTGIVVAVSVTAVALALVRRIEEEDEGADEMPPGGREPGGDPAC